MFQEFQLSVTPLEQDRYLVRTENVAPGVPLAEEQVRWSVDDWLEMAKQLMNDPLLRMLQDNQPLFVPGQPQAQLHDPSSLVDLGQKLYDALFQGSLRDSWITAQGVAHHQGSVLRLRLGLKGNILPRLPWEVLHTGGKESLKSCYRPLATGTDIAFSRYQIHLPAGNPAIAVRKVQDRPLRILMATAGPEDQESLDLQQEAEDLKAELSRTEERAIELQILLHPNREELTQALEQGQYEVFHYAGHSTLGDSGGDIYLVNRTTGLTEILSGEDLAGLLANNGVQLAVFNSCRGADTALETLGQGEGERNLAQALVKCGVPAVLAMAERIPDDVAKTLTRLFYRNLNQGYPIDLSLSRARQGLIAAYGSNQLYWALPVLYLHPKFDGFLMDTGEEMELGQDLLELPDFDEIPLELLGGGGRSPAERFLAEEDEAESDLSAPVAQLAAQNGQYALEEESGSMEDDEAFIRDIMSDLSPPPAPTPEVPPPVTPPPQPQDPQPKPTSSSRSRRGINPLVWIVTGIGAGAIALAGGWWFFTARNANTPIAPATVPSAPQAPGGTDFAQVETETLLSIAVEQFEKGNTEQGQRAIAALLDPERNALRHANAALKAVPVSQQDDPEILFLQGRLAWQSALNGEANFSVDDAWRYWNLAVGKAPNSLIYRNALGFAYYEDQKYDRANQAWSDALELSQEVDDSPNEQVLTTYAGLALALGQMAKTQSGSSQRTLLNKAIKLRQLVMTEDPLNFQPEALSKNWLWSEKTIQDWQGLISAPGEKETTPEAQK